MATCKDCINYEACIERGDVATKELCEGAEKDCKLFKNKADFEKVKHGEWVDNIQKFASPAGVTKDYLIGYKCSLCGRQEVKKEPYCNCGAKMD